MDDPYATQTTPPGVLPRPVAGAAVKSIEALRPQHVPPIGSLGEEREQAPTQSANRNGQDESPFESFDLWLQPRKGATGRATPEAIEPHEVDAVRAWYLGVATPEQEKLATKLFSRGHLDFDLACACRRLALGGYPRLTICAPSTRRDAQGHEWIFRPMTVRRQGAPEDHSPKCCFCKPLRRRKYATHTLKDPDIDEKGAKTFLLGTPTDLSDKIAPEIHGDGSDEVERVEHPGRPTLCSLLMYLIHEALLNVLGCRRNIGEIASAINAVARKIRRLYSILALSDILEIFPHQIEDRPIRLLQQAKGQWPGGELPVAYCLALVEGIDVLGDSLTQLWYPSSQAISKRTGPQIQLDLVSSTKIDIRVRVSHCMGRQVSGPYLVLLKAADKPQDGPIWVDGYAISILDASDPVPVNSDLERRGFRNYMLPLLAELKARSLDVRMFRPVKNIRVTSGSFCNPDIVVEIDGGRRREDRRIVEMGNITTDRYDESKSVTRPRMKEHADLKVVTGNCDANAEALELLLQWLLRPDDSTDLPISTD